MLRKIWYFSCLLGLRFFLLRQASLSLEFPLVDRFLRRPDSSGPIRFPEAPTLGQLLTRVFKN